MRDYNFSVEGEARKYCDLVVDNLIRLGNLSESDSLRLLHQVWNDLERLDDDDFRLHESPYYTAMCMLHHPEFGDNNPEWWTDESLWPPPPDILREW